MAALSASILVSLLPSPAHAGGEEQRVIREKFTAEALPTPDTTYTTACAEEDVNLVVRRFHAPARGLLNVKMEGFSGDWDMWLEDEDRNYLAGSWGAQLVFDDPPVEEFSYYAARPQTLKMFFCNFSGSPEAEVSYTFRFGGAHDGKRDPVLFQERLPVNFVFLGYDQDQIDVPSFREDLPGESRPLVRSRSWYGKKEFLPIQYEYDYDITFAGADYEDRFFDRLKKLGKPGTPTAYQNSYNAQPNNLADIKENVEIDAVAVERWLAMNPPSDVDTRENTVFFINWFGRRDFRFHVYTKTDEKEADTGKDFGKQDAYKFAAWGGTPADDPESGYGHTRRVWFHDLSAGPDRWSRNWRELDWGYMIPPAWEYDAHGWRSPARMTTDLAKLARYVAIDLLFTPAPIYPPDFTPRRLPSHVNLDMNTYEGMPGTDASEEYLKPEAVLKAVADLRPLTKFSIDHQDLDFYEESNVRCFTPYGSVPTLQYYAYTAGLWAAYYLWGIPGCYSEHAYPMWANLFVHGVVNLADRIDDTNADVYEATAFNYALPTWEVMPFLGMADDNYLDGTQSFTYNMTSPEAINYGYGLTSTAIHEYGHHFALSHPHDGYDYERDVDLLPWGRFNFIFTGAGVNSAMSYLGVAFNDEFSQFDRDNSNRWMAAVYAEHALEIAADVTAEDNSAAAGRAAAEVKSRVEIAAKAFARHDYMAAWAEAQRAYDVALQAASDAGVKVRPDRRGTRLAKEEGSQSSLERTPEMVVPYVDPPMWQLEHLSHDHSD